MRAYAYVRVCARGSLAIDTGRYTKAILLMTLLSLSSFMLVVNDVTCNEFVYNGQENIQGWEGPGKVEIGALSTSTAHGLVFS